ARAFDEQLQWLQDWWLWLQLSRSHCFLFSERPLAKYRVHEKSTNTLHQRAYGMDRVKVFRRSLQRYSLTRAAKANVLFNMGANLCDLGKKRSGRRLLWRAAMLSLTEFRAIDSLCKAARRLVISNSY